jgi:hypothetical protein
MVLFPTAGSNRNRPDLRKFGLLGLGTLLAVGTGTLLVKASDNPQIQRVMMEFNRPIRAALEPLVVRRDRPLTEVTRSRDMQRLQPIEARRNHAAPAEAPLPAGLGIATPRQAVAPDRAPVGMTTPAGMTTPVVLPSPALPQGEILGSPSALPLPGFKPREDGMSERRARIRIQSRGFGNGMSVPTNYCVRLCDGFAFPIGESGIGQQVQEVSCRAACPGAETALYVLPAGAHDLSVMSRGGTPYTALPTAFRYQQKVTDACSCRPVGATQSANSFYRDMTLKPGDVIMTSAGAQHFDGAPRFPYKPTNFGEAVKRLTVKREIAIVRSMEMASVRGAFSPSAPPALKARVISEFQQAEKQARRETPSPVPAGQPRGFVELQARNEDGRTLLPVVKKAPSFVALN